MADKITRARVTGNQPYFGQDGVLYLPSEVAPVNVATLGVKSLDDDLTPNLEEVGKNEAEEVAQVKVAPVAAHAPDAPNPQGLPPGTVQSGTGRLIRPAVTLTTQGLGASPAKLGEAGDQPLAVQPVGAEAPVTQAERKEAAAETKQQGATQKPSKK